VSENNESPLLGALRSTPEVPPTRSDLVIKALAELNNQLADVKLKLDISNEIALEMLELRRSEARAESGAQARLIRHKPPRTNWM